MNAPISVVIPVGPHPHNTRWLHECIDSVRHQSVMPREILLIDDGAQLDPERWRGVRCWRAPWRSGVAHAFNFGVALANSRLVVMLGSDDKLLPRCIEECWNTWQRLEDPLGYYYLPVEYADGRTQNVPCNAAMVHKALWQHTGGFPVESAVGACDTVLISMIMAGNGRYGHLHSVSDTPLYWYRNHAETDTETRRGWHGIAAQVRSMKTDEVVEDRLPVKDLPAISDLKGVYTWHND